MYLLLTQVTVVNLTLLSKIHMIPFFLNLGFSTLAKIK